MFLKFKPFTGPERYVFKDPDTGRELVERNKSDLIVRIRQYRSANGLADIEYLPSVLENHWCGLAENVGRCERIERLPRGVWAYLQGGVRLLKTVMYKSFVRQDVADKRAAQCVECKYNVIPTDNAGFEKWSNDLAEAATGGRQSAYHKDLGQCAVCTCVLKMKVFYDGEIDIKKEWVAPMEEVGCWQLKGKS